MLVATVLALAAAGLHAAWNLAAKRSTDPFLALWGQFFVAGSAGAVVLVATRSLPAAGFGWAAVSGAVHVPYVVALASAYRRGDFSVAYPLARGGGALLAGIGGTILLGDEVGAWSMAAIIVVAAGMALLSYGADGWQVLVSLIVAVTIAAYTLVDSHAARDLDSDTYAFAMFAGGGLFISAYGLATGRAMDMVAAMVGQWRRFLVTATMSTLAYAFVLAAVRRAPVGYVTALRESSVLAAAFIGWRYLDEGSIRRRAMASGVILGGLVLLVVTA